MTKLFYTPPAGSTALREELARMDGVDPEHVLVMTGGAEALLILFHLAAEPGANVVLPNPGFPANAAVARIPRAAKSATTRCGRRTISRSTWTKSAALSIATRNSCWSIRRTIPPARS